jgi:hypothetical protein
MPISAKSATKPHSPLLPAPLQCDAVLQKCAECTNARTCTLCKAGHTGVTGGRCSRCKDPNCVFCNTATNLCNACAKGFYLTKKATCVPVSACPLAAPH